MSGLKALHRTPLIIARACFGRRDHIYEGCRVSTFNTIANIFNIYVNIYMYRYIFIKWFKLYNRARNLRRPLKRLAYRWLVLLCRRWRHGATVSMFRLYYHRLRISSFECEHVRDVVETYPVETPSSPTLSGFQVVAAESLPSSPPREVTCRPSSY